MSSAALPPSTRVRASLSDASAPGLLQTRGPASPGRVSHPPLGQGLSAALGCHLSPGSPASPGTALGPGRGWGTNKKRDMGAQPVRCSSGLYLRPGWVAKCVAQAPLSLGGDLGWLESGRAPLPGVPRSRGTQAAGRTWRARGPAGWGRQGLSEGARVAWPLLGRRGPRHWEGEAEEPVNAATSSVNFSKWRGK